MVDGWAFVCDDSGGVIIIDIIVNGWVSSVAVDSYLFQDRIYKIDLSISISMSISVNIFKGGRINFIGSV